MVWYDAKGRVRKGPVGIEKDCGRGSKHFATIADYKGADEEEGD